VAEASSDRLEEIFASLSSELLERHLKSISGQFDIESFRPDNENPRNLTQALDLRAWADSLAPVSRAAEQQLLVLYRQGTAKERIEALEQLIGTSLEFIEKSAKYCLRFGGELEDLVQSGIEGLIKAAGDFDENMGNRFSTYAKWWVRSYQMRAIEDTSRIIRVPAHAFEKYLSYRKLHRNAFGDDEPIGVVMDLCDQVEAKPWMIEAAINAIEKTDLLPMKEIRARAIDMSTEVDGYAEIEESQLHELLDSVLDSLSERESGVIRMRYGLLVGIPQTLDEIAESFNVTRERIRQIESKTMAKLRHPGRNASLRPFVGLEDPFDHDFSRDFDYLIE
jgi:RNA polymerase primary sigma factor